MTVKNARKVSPIEPSESVFEVVSDASTVAGNGQGQPAASFESGDISDFLEQPEPEQPDSGQPEPKSAADEHTRGQSEDDYTDEPLKALVDWCDALQCELFSELAARMGKKIPSEKLIFDDSQRKQMSKFFEIAAPYALAKLANSPFLQASGALVIVFGSQYMKVKRYDGKED